MSQRSELKLRIDGMHCAGCVASIEREVSRLDGVEDCRVNLATRSAYVTYEPDLASQERIIGKIQELGYSATNGLPDVLSSHTKEVKAARHRFYLSLAVTVPLMLIAMYPMISGSHLLSPFWDGLCQGLIAAAVVFYAGRSILADAFRQTAHFRANMNSLIGLGTLTAFGWSVYALIEIGIGRTEPLYFDSAAMIVTLILLGRLLEAVSKGRAGNSIQALLKLAPSRALAVIDGAEKEIDAAMITRDLELIVRPGERIPADGVITDGSPVLDESMLTGESQPIDKQPDDEVIGGSLNGNKSFRMRVTASGEDSFLANVIRVVADAQSARAPVQRLADKVASVFVPIVIGIALVTLAVWYWVAPESPLMIKSVISVLIIACPCALGLATPTAILAGTGRAAKEGILIRGGDILERLTKTDTFVFDKTGTLTHGELEVVDIRTFGEISARGLIRIAGSAELQSEHPVGKAIAAYMQKEQIEAGSIKNVEAFPGVGLKATFEGKEVVVGNRSILKKEQVNLDEAVGIGEEEMQKGRTVVFVALDKEIIGLISLADRVKSDARETITALKKRVARIIMLSGDTRKTAGGVARSIGITEFEAEIKPVQKKVIIESLRKTGHRIAMIGDGINDAPALAASDVGVAIGTGTDIAIETAGVVLVRDNLMSVVRMYDLAGRTMKIIKQNLFWAFFYNIAAIPIAAGLLYPVMGLVLSPMIAAAAMSVSSVFVVTNSLRLNRLEF